MDLIKLWNPNQKPQHYSKWCQTHQIIATNLYYVGLIERSSALGYYTPTTKALRFFEGKIAFPKHRILLRDAEGKDKIISVKGEDKSFSQYLSELEDTKQKLEDYREAPVLYNKRKRKEQPGLTE